jgi:hypothetical protein
MGFFNAFKNIVLGKPIFTTPQQQKQAEHAEHGGVGAPVVAPVGPKVLPPAYIERVQCRQNGHELRCEAVIQNYSQQALLLDKVEIFGKVLYLNGTHLTPGEEHEINLFEGAAPQNTNQNQCSLYYKNEEGDYFCAVHNIEFAPLPSGGYTINYVRFQSPIRDI